MSKSCYYLSLTKASNIKSALFMASNSSAFAPPVSKEVKAIFFDCDDTLYRNDFKLAKALTQSIEDYLANNLGLPEVSKLRSGFTLYQPVHGFCHTIMALSLFLRLITTLLLLFEK